MALSQFPKVFSDKVKGFLTHKFTSQELLNYIGPYPQLADYVVDGMSADKQREFYTWYETISQVHSNFVKEASYYCRNDVEMLRGL